MLSIHLLSSVKNITVLPLLKRNYGITAVILQKTPTDPIQKLFVEKIREYNQKSKAAGGKLVEATPESEKSLKDELEKIERQFGGGPGVDLTQFPTFTFKDPVIDSINLETK
uniref:ATP synthase-coupling factor 6, mitochondrial n=1 Tax=Hemiscolopendra marginata TaxID=943146 RepID=A0A646QIQ0_9MYRI